MLDLHFPIHKPNPPVDGEPAWLAQVNAIASDPDFRVLFPGEIGRMLLLAAVKDQLGDADAWERFRVEVDRRWPLPCPPAR